MKRDLFGNPIPEKKRRRRRSGSRKSQTGSGWHQAHQLELAPPAPGLDDLVARLKPLHHRLEADLARTLERDTTLQQQVTRQCEALSRQQGVAVSQNQYVHTSATVYVLKALFLRVAEDYGLFPAPVRKVALRGDLFRELRNLAPRLTWADYLEYAVRDLAYLPVACDLFKETGYELIPPGDEMARALLDAVADLPDASAGLSTGLRYMDTRALGDLYEHLMDEGERKRLGYYTTPDFIIDFLLERTLEPAVREFGVHELRYLDPACGTGHFLVRAYRRLDQHLTREEPDLTPLERFERIVEDNLFGIDVSEFATRITLFRLFLEGVRLAQREGLDAARWGEDITFNVYTANSLIRLPQEQQQAPLFEYGQPPRREPDPVARWYGRELTHLRVDLRDALTKGFHVVNANPPYVRIQKQGAEVVAPVNGSWETVEFVQYLRDAYETASGNFDLSVPFAERGLELLVPGGYLGYITTGKFAKQAYGKKLARLLAGDRYHLRLFADLTDAQVFEAGAYPALIVLQRPNDGNPVPADAPVEVLATYQPAARSREETWAALRSLFQRDGDVFEEYAGHYQEQQGHFRAHPWTLRRSSRDLLARIKAASDKTLADYVESIGFDFITAADSVFCDYITESFIRRHRLEREICIPCLRGENIRNWTVTWHGNRKREQTYVIYTLDLETGEPIDIDHYPNVKQYLSKYQRYLEARTLGWGGTVAEEGLPWWTINKRNARLGVPKIAWPSVVLRPHAFGDTTGRYLVDHPAQVAYPELNDTELALYLAALMNSPLFAFYVARTASRVRQQYFDIYSHHIKGFPVPVPDGTPAERLIALSREMIELVGQINATHPYHLIRDAPFSSTAEFQKHEELYHSHLGYLAHRWAEVQRQVDKCVRDLYQLKVDVASVLADWVSSDFLLDFDWEKEVRSEIRDYICDLIEDLFAAQRPLQERPLTPAEVAGALAGKPKFEPLRAVYYGGKPISGEQFVRECMDWDCRPIPFDEEAVLVGRKPKRVDVLHERFFRFDGVNRDLYGWTGWNPEAQANIFLTLAEQTQDKTPFYRWVGRLISLPEESPDIEDPDVREGLRGIIGDVEPYPYVVMG